MPRLWTIEIIDLHSHVGGMEVGEMGRVPKGWPDLDSQRIEDLETSTPHCGNRVWSEREPLKSRDSAQGRRIRDAVRAWRLRGLFTTFGYTRDIGRTMRPEDRRRYGPPCSRQRYDVQGLVRQGKN